MALRVYFEGILVGGGGGCVARVSVAMLRVGLGTNEDAVSGVVDVPNRPTLSLSSQCPNKVV